MKVKDSMHTKWWTMRISGTVPQAGVGLGQTGGHNGKILTSARGPAVIVIREAVGGSSGAIE